MSLTRVEDSVATSDADSDGRIVPFTYTQTGLFAVIKKSSKYCDQQPEAANGEGTGGVMPFRVSFVDYATEYCVCGNSNRYRIADLNFFVKCRHGWVRLS